MNWRVKGVIQKVLSHLPGGPQLNDVLQRRLGGLQNLEASVRSKVMDDWVVLVAHLTELNIRPRGWRYLEIGTGWFPTLPVCFALAGADSCVTFDIARHLSPALTARMIDLLGTHLPVIAQVAGHPLADIQREHARLTQTGEIGALLQAARIDYRAPADAAATGLAADSIDVVFSNSVFEHIPPATIARLMEESRRVLRCGGVAVHSVNCGDHYAYFDPAITPIHYLAYSDRQWRRWNNPLQYQNRLRPRDFVEAAQQAGLEVVLCKYRPRPELLARLPQLKIAAEFQKYPPEQLCSTSVDFVARKP